MKVFNKKVFKKVKEIKINFLNVIYVKDILI
jgi:hypothetical protein